jgi:hypothetical protein
MVLTNPKGVSVFIPLLANPQLIVMDHGDSPCNNQSTPPSSIGAQGAQISHDQANRDFAQTLELHNAKDADENEFPNSTFLTLNKIRLIKQHFLDLEHDMKREFDGAQNEEGMLGIDDRLEALIEELQEIQDLRKRARLVSTSAKIHRSAIDIGTPKKQSTPEISSQIAPTLCSIPVAQSNLSTIGFGLVGSLSSRCNTTGEMESNEITGARTGSAVTDLSRMNAEHKRLLAQNRQLRHRLQAESQQLEVRILSCCTTYSAFISNDLNAATFAL